MNVLLMENQYPHQIYWLFSVFQSHRKYVLILLVISTVITGGLWVSSTFVEEETVDTEQTHSFVLSHSQSGVVTENTSTYTVGETVSRTYPHNIVSNVNISTTAQTQSITIDSVDVYLTYEVQERQTNDVFIYQQEQIIGENDSSGTINIHEMRDQIQEYQREFEQSAQVRVFVETEVAYSYTAYDGQEFTHSTTDRHVIGSDGTLTVIQLEDVTAQHTTGVRDTQQTTSYIPVVAFIMTVLLVLSVLIYRKSGEKSANSWAKIAEHNKHKQWFTELENSNIPGNPSINYVKTLSGLVDAAINSQQPVMWDSNNDEYILQIHNSVYVYGPDLEPDDTPAFLMFGMGSENYRGGNLQHTFGNPQQNTPTQPEPNKSDFNFGMEDVESTNESDSIGNTNAETTDVFGEDNTQQ